METKTKIVLSIFGLLVVSIASISAMYVDGQDIAEKQNFYIVSNTEYWSSETGQIIARFTDFQGTPIPATNCSTDVLYPNETTFFLQDELMTQSLISGDWYYMFTVPNEVGVYDYAVTCVYQPNNKEITKSKTFHVSPALNAIKAINETVVGLETSLVEINGILVDINTTTTNVYDDTQFIRNNFVTNEAFQNNITIVTNDLTEIKTNLTTLMDYCGNVETNSSSLCLLINGIDQQLNDLNATLFANFEAQLQEINQTTHNTYDLLSGTITTNINQILLDLGFVSETVVNINNTVNSIQTDTTNILTGQGVMQDNVTDILSNQEAEVNLNILS